MYRVPRVVGGATRMGLTDLHLIRPERSWRRTDCALGVGSAELSPDGARVAWCEALPGAKPMRPKPYQLWLGDTIGEAMSRVLMKRAPVLALAWSPDGQWLAVSLPGEIRIVGVLAKGSHTISLKQLDASMSWHGAHALRWRPDGRALAFASYYLGQTEDHNESADREPTRAELIVDGRGTWVVKTPCNPLPAPTKAQRDEVARQLVALDAKEFKAREAASAALHALGPAMVPRYQSALNGASPEAKRRLEALIATHRKARFLPRLRLLGWTR